jgi:hypothetical protein
MSSNFAHHTRGPKYSPNFLFLLEFSPLLSPQLFLGHCNEAVFSTVTIWFSNISRANSFLRRDLSYFINARRFPDVTNYIPGVLNVFAFFAYLCRLCGRKSFYDVTPGLEDEFPADAFICHEFRDR